MTICFILKFEALFIRQKKYIETYKVPNVSSLYSRTTNCNPYLYTDMNSKKVLVLVTNKHVHFCGLHPESILFAQECISGKTALINIHSIVQGYASRYGEKYIQFESLNITFINFIIFLR